MNLFKNFIFSFLLITLLGCSKENDGSDSLNSNLSLSILGKNYDYFNYGHADVKLEKFNIDKSINSNILTLNAEFKEMSKNILKFYNLEILGNEQFRSITFYGKDNNFTINNNISGFSILKSSKIGFYQEMYKIENGKAILQKEFTRDYHYGIFIETFGYFSYKLNRENNYFLTILNSEYSNSTLKAKFSKADYQVELAYLEQFPIIITPEISSSSKCSMSGCSSNASGICGVNGGEDVVCNPETKKMCAEEDSEEAGAVSEIREQARVAMYDIRDNTLSLTSKGKEYIDYYYKLSYVLRITGMYEDKLSDMEEIMRFIHEKSLLFVSGVSGVIINSSDAAYIKSKIAAYKNLTSNPEYKSILDVIETDVTNLTNKSRADILLYLL